MAIDQMHWNELDFIWEAFYVDGTSLKQFDFQQNAEFHFGHIDQEKLSHFTLYNKRNPAELYVVRLTDGYIRDRYNTKIAGEDIQGKFPRIKLIYFRRMRREINGLDKPVVTHFIGWHGEVLGQHKKHQIAVTPTGDYAVIS